MNIRKTSLTAMAASLLAAAVMLAGTESAMADSKPSKIPHHVKVRLEKVCSQSMSKGQIARMGELDLNRIVKLMEQKQSPRVSHYALYSLGEIKDPRATDALLAMLKSSDPRVRRAAVHALGKIRDKRAVMPLIEILCRQNESVAVQSYTALALGKLGDPRAKRMLAYLARHENGWVQSEASKALMKIGPGLEVQMANR